MIVNFALLYFLFQLVRLVANLSIHSEVGPSVAKDEDTVDCLLQILGEVVQGWREEETGKIDKGDWVLNGRV